DGQGGGEDLAEALLAAGADRIAAGAQGEEHGVLAEFGQAQQARLGLGDQGIHGLLRELAEDLRLHAQSVAAVVEPFDIAMAMSACSMRWTLALGRSLIEASSDRLAPSRRSPAMRPTRLSSVSARWMLWAPVPGSSESTAWATLNEADRRRSRPRILMRCSSRRSSFESAP